ncbi:MAG: DUF4347 domain-containing protein [Pirellulaceae bacterium]
MKTEAAPSHRTQENMLESLRKILSTLNVLADELRAVTRRAVATDAAATAGPPAMVRQLESRVLLSVSPAAAAGDASSTGGSTMPVACELGTLVSSNALEDTDAPSTQANAASDGQSAMRRELLFIDSGLDDDSQLLSDLSDDRPDRWLSVVAFDGDRDGIEQIAAALQEYTDLDAVHFVTHGTDGAVKLGSTWLRADSLDAYAGNIAGWAQSLSDNADLLFYGCDVAGNAAGRTLIESLATLTGADVAASTDNTGHAGFAGNWELEFQTGSVGTRIAFSRSVQENWRDLLGVITVSTTNDVLDGNTSSVAALLGNAGVDGFISLREAIIATNNSAGADTVLLASGSYLLTRTGAGEDAANSGDLDITGPLTISGAGAQTTFVDGAGADRVFAILGSTVTMSGLTIQNGSAADGAGIHIDGSGSLTLRDAVLAGNTAAHSGGAIDTSGTLLLDRVTIVGNSANEGGGVYIANGASAVLTNVTISGNTAANNGGAISTKDLTAITNSTIAFNSSSGTGGIYVTGAGDASLKNTILANNAGGNSNTALNSLGHNIDSANTAGLAGPGDLINTFPLLDSVLANNGGCVPTHRLLAGSPAINAGTSTGAPMVDQRGYLRDVSPDIGAYEYDGTNPSPNTAPVLDGAKSLAIGTVNEDAGPPSGAVGTLVSSLVDFASPGGQLDNVTDPDSGALLGLAITAADTTNGAWYYSTNGGTNWNALGAVSDANARLLAADANARIYFQPNANYNGTLAAALTFRAWDQTSGTGGAVADASTNGGLTAYSSTTDVASLVVNAVNDVPVITSNGGGATATTSVAENTTAVTTVTTTDADLPVQTLAYSISGGADAAKFAIDGATGELSFLTAPNYEVPTDAGANNVYDVTVHVADGVGGTDTQAISVTVTDAVEGNVLVVDTTNDVVNGNTTSIAALLLNKGVDGRISLREAILATNNTANGTSPDEIRFDVPNSDIRHFYYRDDGIAGSLSLAVTTTLADASIADFDADYPYAAHSWFRLDLNPILPELEITDALSIDGYSQLGTTRNTLSSGDDAQLRIELTSTGIDDNRGLVVQPGGAGSTIRGLVINGFAWAGILTEPGADGVTIQGNFLGTDITGTLDLGNGDAGVHLRSSSNQVGGSNPDDRNVISGNDGRGVVTFTFGPIATANVVQNNYVGVDATGLVALGNTTAGIQVWNQDGMRIQDNVIAGNDGDGIWLRAGSTNVNTLIQGNRIGVGAKGIASVGNIGAGILIETGSAITIGGALAGQANTIANNSSDGVSMTGGTGAAIRGNTIFNNAGLGIDLLGSNGATANDANDADNGPNNLQNFPVLANATVYGADLHVVGQLQSTAATNFVIDFYWSPAGDPSGYGEGQTYIGSTNVTTNGSGNASFNLTFTGAGVPVGALLSATATKSNALFTLFTDTSEFAQSRLAGSPLEATIDTNAAANQVAENAANGATVGITALATDPDVGDTVSYSLDNNAGGRFAINNITGVVTVADGTLLDREAASSHDITVRAKSSDTSSSTQFFTINVLPVNDNNPVITSHGGGATAAINIAENTTAVTTITASDADLPAQTLTYSISGGADAAKFTINGATGVLSFLAAPNYESPTDAGANNVYDLTVQVSDGTLTDTQALAVTVTDMDEFDIGAIADSDATADFVLENATNGTVVGVMALADDADGTDTVSYVMDDNAGGRFAIHATSGVVTVSGALDRETVGSYDIIVRASSSDTTSTTRTFTITLGDVDEFDVGVVVDSAAAANTVVENAANGTVIGLTALASDADATNNAITYSLDDDAGGRFAIQATTGVVTVNGALDYEIAASHSVIIRATSSDGSCATWSFAIAVSSDFVPPPPPVPDNVLPSENTQTSDNSLEDSTSDSSDDGGGTDNLLVPEAAPRLPNRIGASTDGVEGQADLSPASDADTEREPIQALFLAQVRGNTVFGALRQSHSEIDSDADAPTTGEDSGRDNTTGIDSRTFVHLGQSGKLWQDLDQFHGSLASDWKLSTFAIGSVGTIASGFTVGYVLWVLRSGLLLSSVLASLPVWTMFDPLMVVSESGPRDDGQDEESLEDIVENHATCTAAQSHQDSHTEPLP